MKNVLNLVSADLKNIFRDKALFMVLFVPFIFIILINYGLPVLLHYYPVVNDFTIAILAFACLLTSIFPAYVLSFVMLDEKDLGLIPVLRISPFAFSQFLLYRIVFLYLLSFVLILITLVLTDLLPNNLLKMVILSATTAFLAPLAFLTIVLLAKNKIEGVTYFKLVNTLMALPLIAFYIDHPAVYLSWLVPVYWTFAAFHATDITTLLTSAAISIMIHFSLTYWLYRRSCQFL